MFYARARRQEMMHDACQELGLPQDVWLQILNGFTLVELYRLRTVCQCMHVMLPLAVSIIEGQCEFERVAMSFDRFVNLRVLSLSHHLSDAEQSTMLLQATQLRRLHTLLVRSNDVIDCPNVVSQLTNLTDLSLCHPKLMSDNHLAPLTNLRRLQISYPSWCKKIEPSINASLTRLTNLESLTIIGATRIENEILAHLTCLKSLSIIYSLPVTTDTLKAMVNLTSLNLQCEKVVQLPDVAVIRKLPKLKHLNLMSYDSAI
jgi:hypothetical protein